MPGEDQGYILGSGLAQILEAFPLDRREQARGKGKTFRVSLVLNTLSLVGPGVR